MKKSAEDILTEVYESYNKEMKINNKPGEGSIDISHLFLEDFEKNDRSIPEDFSCGQRETEEEISNRLNEFIKDINQKENKRTILDQAKESTDYYSSKFDQGKTNFSLIFSDFPMAIKSVAEVAEFGAEKYSAHSWMLVPDAQERYTNALFRHLMDEMSGEEMDSDSEFLHAAHVAWNALARLELMLIEKQKDPGGIDA